MPTLDWIGKSAVVNHHQEIPYRLLHSDEKLSVGDPGQGNLLVEGDNLHALKALLPYYAGKVKCIYIDPPYNTGEEGWVYNDNVNSPDIRKWLGEVVGDDVKDLSRHDKWLCMMYPRLSLLHQFMRKDGVILVSIDHNEVHRLRLLMEEVFGGPNFIAELVWEKTRKNDAKLFSVGHEYIIVYARSLATLKAMKTVWRESKLGAKEIVEFYKNQRAIHGNDDEKIEAALREWYKQLPKGHPSKKLSRYKHIDKNGPWRDRDISWPGGGGPRYDVPHPVTGQPCRVPERGWGFATQEAMQRQIDLELVEFREDHSEPPFRKAHIIPIPEELEDEPIADDEGTEAAEDDQFVGLQVMPSVIYKQSQVAVKHLRSLMGAKVFSNPKDYEVIARLINYCTASEPNCVILDSFAGSGSTGHAVMQLNKEDGGNRRFILVEMEQDISRNITAERLKRVITGYGDKERLGGGFRYCTLGEPLFDEQGKIRPGVRFPELARHVFFTETGEPLPEGAKLDSPLIGIHNGTALYLLFNGILGDKSVNGGNVLTNSTLISLPPHNGPRLIFGEGCRLSIGRLRREGISFKQIPYQVKVS